MKRQRMVKIIATDFEAGQILTGRVISIKEFGAFIEFAPGKKEWYTFPRSVKKDQPCGRCSYPWR